MENTNAVLDESIQIATLLAQVLPGLITVYNKIVANNQNAGLVPASTLLADVVKISGEIEQTAAQEIAGT